MLLQPCDRCRRHIDRHAEACPFCATPNRVGAPRAMLTGRLSRAMLFASATLVSCDQAAKPGATESGSGSAAIKAPSTTWKLHGVVKDSQGQPLAGATVHLMLEGAAPTQPVINTSTDAYGRYQVENATSGRYSVAFNWYDQSESLNRGGAHTTEIVTLVIGSDQTLNATMDPSVPAMPYGAPPSRRRVV